MLQYSIQYTAILASWADNEATEPPLVGLGWDWGEGRVAVGVNMGDETPISDGSFTRPLASEHEIEKWGREEREEGGRGRRGSYSICTQVHVLSDHRLRWRRNSSESG